MYISTTLVSVEQKKSVSSVLCQTIYFFRLQRREHKMKLIMLKSFNFFSEHLVRASECKKKKNRTEIVFLIID